jgi:maleate cis-trans isomerase
MTEPRHARPYGARGRIGLIVPSPNTVCETEMRMLAPEGVTVHTARLLYRPEDGSGALAAMDAHLPRTLDELAGAEVDVIAYACTASSVEQGPETICSAAEERTGIPTIATAGAVLDALRALGAGALAIATPYPEAVNASERRFFGEHGFRVTADISVLQRPEQKRLRHMCLVDPALLVAEAKRIVTPDTDALFLSCTDMPSLVAIATLEAELDVPVVSSTQATFWQALRRLGLDDRVPGAGRLLRDH